MKETKPNGHTFHVDFSEAPYFNPCNIPEELRILPHWVGWKFSDDSRKLPVDAKTGKLARVNDRDTWSSFNKAQLVWCGGGPFDGLGFVLSAGHYVGIDLDDCRDPQTKSIEPWAQAIIDELDSYTEISQSGTGVHIIVIGCMSEGRHRCGQVEIYNDKRYFVMTGNVLPGHESIFSRDLRDFERRMAKGTLQQETDQSESGEDWHLVARLAERTGITDVDALEAAFRKRHPKLAADRDARKGNRNGMSYIRYTITNYLQEKGADQVESVDSADPSALKLVRMSEVKATEPTFLIKPYFPQGCLSLLVGDPGTGKSLVALSILAHLTTGRPILGEKLGAMGAIFLSNEDPSGISRWRFDRVCGDPNRVMLESYNGKMFTLDDAKSLEEAIRQHRPRFVVIDSVMSHLGRGLDSYKANEVATVLTPLVGIAEKYNVVILGLMHMNKKEASRVLYRVQASIGFTAGARSVLALDYDPDHKDERILCHIKSNNAALGPSQALSVADATVEWKGESPLKAGDLFGNELSGEDRRARHEAEEFLREVLADGAMPSEEVKKEAKAQGIAERTLLRAKQVLGIESEKTKTGKWIFVPPKKWNKAAKGGS